jgi:hypothetical protein
MGALNTLRTGRWQSRIVSGSSTAYIMWDKIHLDVCSFCDDLQCSIELLSTSGLNGFDAAASALESWRKRPIRVGLLYCSVRTSECLGYELVHAGCVNRSRAQGECKKYLDWIKPVVDRAESRVQGDCMVLRLLLLLSLRESEGKSTSDKDLTIVTVLDLDDHVLETSQYLVGIPTGDSEITGS